MSESNEIQEVFLYCRGEINHGDVGPLFSETPDNSDVGVSLSYVLAKPEECYDKYSDQVIPVADSMHEVLVVDDDSVIQQCCGGVGTFTLDVPVCDTGGNDICIDTIIVHE